MLKVFALAPVLLAVGCASVQPAGSEETRLIKGFPNLPNDARQVVERIAECNHWAGETGDNPPEREQEIHNAITKLGCDRVEQDAAVLRLRYQGNPEVSNALAAAENY